MFSADVEMLMRIGFPLTKRFARSTSTKKLIMEFLKNSSVQMMWRTCAEHYNIVQDELVGEVALANIGLWCSATNKLVKSPEDSEEKEVFENLFEVPGIKQEKVSKKQKNKTKKSEDVSEEEKVYEDLFQVPQLEKKKVRKKRNRTIKSKI